MAHWINIGFQGRFLDHPHSEYYKCSNCGYEQYTLYESEEHLYKWLHTCPNCGAKMDGERSDGERREE